MNVLIVGAGQVGSYLAALLHKVGHTVRVVEMRPKQLKALQHDLPQELIVAGEFSDPAVLEAAGIGHADVVVAVTPTDEGNLVVSTLARFEYGVRRVIARANNPKNAWMFTPEMGVDVGLTEADLMAHVVEEEMSLGEMMTLLKLHQGDYSLVKESVHEKSAAVGRMIKELSLPLDCVLVAVLRDEELIIPHGSTTLMAGDEVMAITHAAQANALAARLGTAKA